MSVGVASGALLASRFTPIVATTGFGTGAEKVGVAVVALLAAVAVLGRGPLVSERWRALATLGAVALTPVLLLIDIWNTSQVHHLRHHPAEAVAAIVVGLAIVAVLALLIHKRPRSLALLAVAALPFRLPISTGGSPSNLLIPLYLVVGAAALAHAAASLRGRPIDPGEDTQDAPPGRLEWLLLGSVVLYALQASYSADFSKALENVVFFYVPFALLFGMLRRLRWTRELLLACLGIALAEAIAFAGIGFVEYARKQLLLNPAVVQANDYDNYFRVNSLFFDPNIYGRFLAVVMIALTTLVMWSRRRRDIVIAAGVALWLLAGMVTSFSQSSIAAFAVGLAVIAAYRWNVRETLLVCVGLLAVAGLVLVFAPSSSHLGISGTKSANNATSGRATLVDTGLTLFAHRPLEGYGPGSFPTEYLRHNRRAAEQDATSASHTIPVTIAAEQGVIGLAVYVALLIAAFGRLFAGARGSPERIAIAACFGALVLHTMTYADFLEDPTTWALLAIGAALALGGARVDADADPRPDADVDVDVAQVTPASAG